MGNRIIDGRQCSDVLVYDRFFCARLACGARGQGEGLSGGG